MTQIFHPCNYTASQKMLDIVSRNGYKFTYSASPKGIVVVVWNPK